MHTGNNSGNGPEFPKKIRCFVQLPVLEYFHLNDKNVLTIKYRIFSNLIRTLFTVSED
jgi:hypothetical protein